MFNATAYDRVAARIKPNRDRLDDEFIDLPQMILEVAENMAAAYTLREQAEYTHKCAMSDAANEMRMAVGDDGKKLPETHIARDLPTHPKVYETFVFINTAREDYARWGGLMSALEAKKASLNKLSDFVLSGFMASNAGSHAAGRAALTKARNDEPQRRPKITG